MGKTESTFYHRFSVVDRPGILAKSAGALGGHGAGIRSVIQTARKDGIPVPVVIVTHKAGERGVGKALEEIAAPGIPSESVTLLRIEDDPAWRRYEAFMDGTLIASLP
ncbi:MAG: ACT domain-containing protein [Geobacteraceae bacterium]|nr:ACT domain-containing protein [Geobacteraceae bacterium]